MRVLAILGVKNEGAFLIEWLAHHRSIGFTDILVYSNDCSDGTDLMLDRLHMMGLLTHMRNPGPHDQGPQWAMLKSADRHPLTRAADWIMVCDIDEFVNIHIGVHTGRGHVSDLIAALPDADAIALTWRLFGNAGHVTMQDLPVTRTFTLAAPATLGWPWRAQMIKTLFKNDGTYRKLGVHRPRSPAEGAAPRWFDGSGRDLGEGFTRIFSDYTRDNYQLAQLNHYPLGAIENYLIKADRGRANRDASGFDLGYWIERNLNEVEDRTILAHDSSGMRAQLHSDPVLGPLHKAAFAWRQNRLAQLLRAEDWRALFGRLLMAQPSRSLDAVAARQILRFAPSRD